MKALFIAIRTYSILPVPDFEWTERSMRNSVCCLPLVGLLVGAALWLWHRVCCALGADGVLFAAVAAALPLAVTGGIHMDGFMDTTDALASHQPRERKLEILKDPHCGAFAVLWCAAYLLVSFGLYHALYQSAGILPVCAGFALSRALAVLSAFTLKNARGEGMLFAFTEHAQASAAIAAMGLVSIGSAALMCAADFGAGAAGAILALFAGLLCRSVAKRQFGGATGDTTGFCLQVCELAVLFGAWIGGLV